jgi:hypothetical protein
VTDSETEGAVDLQFAGLIVSLQAGAMAALGLSPSAETGKTEKNLDQARQIIDLLAMLEVKTKGNLTPAEQDYLEQALYQLRMTFVEESRKSGGG